MATAYPIHHPLISRRVADAADRFEPVTDSVLGHRSLGAGARGRLRLVARLNQTSSALNQPTVSALCRVQLRG
jgi:hypothetical protein